MVRGGVGGEFSTSHLNPYAAHFSALLGVRSMQAQQVQSRSRLEAGPQAVYLRLRIYEGVVICSRMDDSLSREPRRSEHV